MDEIILKTYKTFGYPSTNVLCKILRKEHDKITLKDIEKVIKKQEPYQIHKKVKSSVQSHIVAFNFNEIVQMDLIDLSTYATTNKSFKWLLIIEDVFSRKAFGYALQNKLGSTVLEAFKLYVDDNGFPRELISDNGKEFVNNNFQEYVKGKVYHKLVEPNYHKTLGIVDPLCRTLKEKLFRYFYAENTTNWIDKIDQLIVSYNNTPHRSLGYLSPNEVKDNAQYVQKLNQDKLKETKQSTHKFAVGQYVRYKLKKAIFDKGYLRIWSSEVFQIKEIKGVNAVLNNDKTYKLSNLQIVEKPDEPLDEEKKNEEEDEVQIPREDEVRKVENVAREKRYLRKEGVNPENIIEDPNDHLFKRTTRSSVRK